MDSFAFLLLSMIISGFEFIPCRSSSNDSAKRLYPPLLLEIREQRPFYQLATNIVERNTLERTTSGSVVSVSWQEAIIGNDSGDQIAQFCPVEKPDQWYENESWLEMALSRYSEPNPHVSVEENVCESPVKASLFRVHKCAAASRNAQLDEYQIGYAVYVKDGGFAKSSEKFDEVGEHFTIVQLLKLRFDSETANTVSVSHVIASPNLLQTASGLPIVRDPEDYDQDYDMYKDINSLYSEQNQRKIFVDNPAGKFATYFEYPEKALIKRQLAPVNDFLLPVWKEATYMDANTAPMWNTLTSVWQLVEIFVRKVAVAFKGLDIETGAAEILQIPDPSNPRGTRQLYLGEDQKLAVPALFWKLVTHKETVERYNTVYSSILIIMPNDPLPVTTSDPVCQEKVFGRNKWFDGSEEYEGFVYCCEVTEEIIKRLKLHLEIVPQKVLDLSNVHTSRNEVAKRRIAAQTTDAFQPDTYPRHSREILAV